MTQPECPHDEAEFVVTMTTVENPPFRFADVRARCATCHQQFHFHGIPSGHPNPESPAVTADGYEVHLPIQIGPGAVVGLLERTGMGDSLVRPETP